MSLTEIVDAVSADTTDALAEAMRECAALRKTIREGVPAIDYGPEALHEFLIRCRQAEDRVEEVLAQMIVFRGKVENAVRERRGSVEDGEVTALKTKVGSGDYTSAKERSVEFRLHTLDETRKLRAAEALLTDVKTAYEYVRTLYFGIDGTRKETDTRLRAITLVSALER